MEDSDSTGSGPAHGAGKRAIAFLIAAAMLVAGERLAQDWLFPGMAVNLAMEQLDSDDAAASRLRLFDAAGQLLPLGTAMAIIAVGAVIFAPKPRVSFAWLGGSVRQCRERFARSAVGLRFVRQSPDQTEGVKAKDLPDPLCRKRAS